MRPQTDLVARLLDFPNLSPHLCGLVAREAAAEIVRLRGPQDMATADFDRHLVTRSDGSVWVPQPLQWTMLELLLRRAGKTVASEALLDAMYGDRIDGGPECPVTTLKVNISHMRRSCPWPIRSVYRVGYCLEGYRR